MTHRRVCRLPSTGTAKRASGRRRYGSRGRCPRPLPAALATLAALVLLTAGADRRGPVTQDSEKRCEAVAREQHPSLPFKDKIQ